MTRTGSGQKVLETSRVEWGQFSRCSTYHGSGRVCSAGVRSLTGRVGSVQEAFEVSRVGLDRVILAPLSEKPFVFSSVFS